VREVRIIQIESGVWSSDRTSYSHSKTSNARRLSPTRMLRALRPSAMSSNVAAAVIQDLTHTHTHTRLTIFCSLPDIWRSVEMIQCQMERECTADLDSIMNHKLDPESVRSGQSQLTGESMIRSELDALPQLPISVIIGCNSPAAQRTCRICSFSTKDVAFRGADITTRNRCR
jgi:hypothetical protein